MMSVQEVKDWLDTLCPDSGVGIDEGGLALVVWPDREASEATGPYLDIGGIPSDDLEGHDIEEGES